MARYSVQTTTLTWDPESGWSPDPATVPTQSGRTLALAFCAPDSEPPLDDLRSALGDVDLVACSTAGQILGREIDLAPVVAAVLVFDDARVSTVHRKRDMGAQETGAAIGAELAGSSPSGDMAGVLVFGGGLDINGQALVRGMAETLPTGTLLSGGLAADGDRFEHAWVYCNGESGPDVVAAVAVFGSSVHFSNGSEGGWDGFGPRRTITRSDGNTLYELDGQPALPLYKEYLGERADELPASAMLFPLAVSQGDGDTPLVRTVLNIDEDDQSMTFAGDVPEGWQARLMWTTKDDLIDGAEEAALNAHASAAQFALAISCVGRRLVLSMRTEEEIDSVVDTIGETVPLVGFYSYGEITSINGMYALHNQTMTITTIREDGGAA